MKIRILICATMLLLISCANFSKLQYSRIYKRDGWQWRDRVIESLNLKKDDKVLELGPGSGYFTFALAEKVAPSGQVFALDVDEKAIAKIQGRVAEEKIPNLHASVYDGSLIDLKGQKVNVIFSVNVYHHLPEQIKYFEKLKSHLAPGGRIAVIDHHLEMGMVLRIFVSKDHQTPPETIRNEMDAAGYKIVQTEDYLPLQSFMVFEAK
ncbi:Methyltransferase type 12 [Turneriella parva DSM 21527]|uniref:Methyltransferase type 12 n=2 Tax=Turneriella TaxID=338321 RepID=I4B9X7_TURPD|nr:Methyltransferase type 12 [Turneriella parva DSM 21527]